MSNIPIFLNCGNKLVPMLATVIASACSNTKSFLDFYVLYDGITDENKKMIESMKQKFSNFSIEFIEIDSEKCFEKIEYIQSSYVPIHTYNRFLISKIKPDIERAIYLDIDLIVMNDIEVLWRSSLDNCPVGMVLDSGKNERVELVKTQLDLEKYFNAGVLLIDLNEWKKIDILKKVFKTEKLIRDKMQFADQDILNKIFSNDCKVLDSKFNVQYGAKDVVIRHFVNVYKPWKTNYFMIGNKVQPLANFDDFWYYAKMTPFYEQLHEEYLQNINKNPLTKRLSIIADKMKNTTKSEVC